MASQQEELIKHTIHKTRKHYIDILYDISKFIYSKDDNIDNNSFKNNSYFNDTLYTLFQYKNDGYNSKTILDGIVTYMPIIEVMEDVYDSLHTACSLMSEVYKYSSPITENSVRMYGIVRGVIESSKTDSFARYILKNEFNSLDNFSFQSSYNSIDENRSKIAYLINQLWLDEFGKIRDNYTEEVQRKHLDRHLEHIRGQKYSIKEYISSVNDLNLLDVYKQLLNFESSNTFSLNIRSNHN